MPDQPLPDSDDRLVERLLARIHRKPLRPVEEARGLRTLMTSRGWTGERLAMELRIPQSRVSRSLSLLRLPSDVQDQLDRSEMPPSTADEITKVADPEDQV
ncbi:ParB/RepB/Spo0J family partition protein [Paludisphaera soli]|uniref:ParB/RepB/Spo0J family partition protein n=1 Tax=Paludisphaera soli TaxID=2712865 RepID=UPI0013EB260C|nr:hypothetical protein [Paludisphaera soli]